MVESDVNPDLQESRVYAFSPAGCSALFQDGHLERLQADRSGDLVIHRSLYFPTAI